MLIRHVRKKEWSGTRKQKISHHIDQDLAYEVDCTIWNVKIMNLPEINRKDNCLVHMKKLKKMKNDGIICVFKRGIIMIVHLHINQN